MQTQKIIRFFLIIVTVFGGGILGGWSLFQHIQKPQIIHTETIKSVKIPIDYDDTEYIAMCFREASEKTGVNEKVLWAIRECEGGNAWALSSTQDIGHLQINIKTARLYGTKDLRLIDPCQEALIAAKILKDRGLSAWTQKSCIEKKLLFDK